MFDNEWKYQNLLSPITDLGILSLLVTMTMRMNVVQLLMIANMAFQAFVKPPGGVWRDDTSSHRAGEAIIAYTHPVLFHHFMWANFTTLFSSVIAIFLIVSGATQKSVFFRELATTTMCVMIVSMAVSGGISLAINVSYIR